MKDFYIIRNGLNFIKKNKNEQLSIYVGQLWSFKKTPTGYDIFLFKEGSQKSNHNLSVSSVGFNLFLENSLQVSNPFKHKDIKTDVLSKTEEDAYFQIKKNSLLWLENFCKQISKNSPSANYKEINKQIETFCNYLSYLNIDGTSKGTQQKSKSLLNPDNETQKALNFISNPNNLILNQENHGLKTNAFKYIAPLEKMVISSIETLIDYHMHGSEEFDLLPNSLRQIMEILQISHDIHKGSIKKAHQSCEYNSIFEEYITPNLFKQFIEKNDTDIKKLSQQAKNDLLQYEVDKLKKISTQTKQAPKLKL